MLMILVCIFIVLVVLRCQIMKTNVLMSFAIKHIGVIEHKYYYNNMADERKKCLHLSPCFSFSLYKSRHAVEPYNLNLKTITLIIISDLHHREHYVAFERTVVLV